MGSRGFCLTWEGLDGLGRSSVSPLLREQVGCVLESELSPGKWDNHGGREGEMKKSPKERERGLGRAHAS